MDDLPTQVESLQAQMTAFQANLTSILWISALLSFVFALAAAYVAARRGHNVFRWAMLGAMLGPIALGLVVLIPSAKVATKTCPDCAEDVKAEAVKCRFCGYRFDQPEIVPRIT
jgi:Uncharacterised protein family UPF0547